MRWIKATERLPELNKPVCFRIYERRYAGEMKQEGIFSHNGYACTYGVGSVEWLDESDEWISVEKEFPEKNKWVLLYNSHWTGVGKYAPEDDDEAGHRLWQDETGEYIAPYPTHWQPLPQPPKQ